MYSSGFTGRMTISMAKSQPIFEEECEVDRILSLPRNVIDCILEFMPIRDAARTCVLSSKWRYVWEDHPSLVIDKDFWDDVQRNRLPNKTYMDFANVFSSILLYHVGQIRKFVIDVSVVSSVLHSSIDLWLSSLSRRSLLELDLRNSTIRNLYKVHSWVFSTCELTHLSISNCIMKTKDNVGCFTKIKCLVLKQVSLDSWVLTTPLLTSLTLWNCRGIRGFNIDAPRLAVLTLHANDCLNLKPYLTCTGITNARFFSNEKIEHSEECESANLVKLASAWPSISALAMEGFFVAMMLCLYEFFVVVVFDYRLVEVNYIVEPSIMDYKFEQLRTVKMKSFTASRVQVTFAEILLHCAPLLGKMLVHENYGVIPNIHIKILKKLGVLQRAFRKAEIIFGPNIVFPLHSFR